MRPCDENTDQAYDSSHLVEGEKLLHYFSDSSMFF